MNAEIKFQATHVVYTVQGPIYACQEHAGQIVGLGRFMGMNYVAQIYVGEPQECSNCINQNKKR